MKLLLPPLLLALSLPVLADEESDYRMAREAFQRGDAARLEQAAQRLQDSVLEPYVTSYRLRLRLADKETAPIRDFLQRTAESPVVDQLRGEWLKSLGKRGRWEEFGEEYPRLVAIDDELRCYGLQLHSQYDEDAALGEARQMWFTGKEMPDSCGPLFRQGVARGIISELDVWLRIRLALESGNATLARQLIQHLPKAQQFAGTEIGKAASQPQRYLDQARFDNTGRRLVALFALQRLARQSLAVAEAHWQRIGRHFTDEEQRYFFGWLGYYGALAHDERALGWYAAAGDEALNDKQLAWRVRAALRAGDWHEVWHGIASMEPEQQGEGAWRYWKGRALRELGRPHDAEALFVELSREHNYYGQLAAEELGAAPGAAMVSANYEPSPADIDAVQGLPGIQRTLQFYRMDFRTEGIREWAWATRNFSDRQLLAAAELARRNGIYDRAINAADRTTQLHDFNLRYPAPYRDVLHENLHENGLEEAWVYGLMRQESRFTVQAKSTVGAAGVMQIMPATAQWVAQRMGMKGYRKGMIHQLDVNIKLGTYYMKTVSTQFNHNPVLASAAYNAGPNRAKQWRAARPLEGAIYVETIPFDETRDYVRKVMSNTVYYSKLFGDAPRPLKQRLGIIEARPAERKNGLTDEG